MLAVVKVIIYKYSKDEYSAYLCIALNNFTDMLECQSNHKLHLNCKKGMVIPSIW